MARGHASFMAKKGRSSYNVLIMGVIIMKAKSVVRDFPVVCVGGSAGGLDAYIRLLRHLPADMGVAIVIVNHLRTVPPSSTRFSHAIPRCRLN